MGDQPRSWQEVFDTLLPEAEVANLGRRIGSKQPAGDFRLAVTNVAAFAIGVATSNPRPWQEQKRGLKEVAKRAKKAAAAVRELDQAFDNSRWVHSRQQLMGAAGWVGVELSALAAQLDNLAFPARAMAEIHPAPRHEVFAIFVQFAAAAFTAATGKLPSFTYDPIEDCYTGPFVELVESVWAKIVAVGEAIGLIIEGPSGKYGPGKAAQRLMDKL